MVHQDDAQFVGVEPCRSKKIQTKKKVYASQGEQRMQRTVVTMKRTITRSNPNWRIKTFFRALAVFQMLVSKETVELRRWGNERQTLGIKQVCKV